MSQRFGIHSLIAAFCFCTSAAAGQQRPVEYDLAKLASGKRLRVMVTNRAMSGFTDSTRHGLHLSEGPAEGAVYLEGVEFANGTIELDIRGKDVQGQSFVGVAFHGVDSSTYEAIYFRPFNFRVADSTRHAHAVQYISQPDHPWQKLRAEHPGMYENVVNPAPDPNGWFHARVVVAGSQVRVFVDGATEPSLVVTRLSERSKGLVGVWVGNGSGADFANLTIRP
jgi:hypothetical protein